MANALGQDKAIIAACRIKNLDPALVIDVRLTADDIFLQTKELGEVRVELSALLESVQQSAPAPVHAEQAPPPLLIPDVPQNTLAALVEAGYTTLASVSAASDEDLLAVDGVGKAMLKRIRDQLEIPF